MIFDSSVIPSAYFLTQTFLLGLRVYVYRFHPPGARYDPVGPFGPPHPPFGPSPGSRSGGRAGREMLVT